MHAQGLQDIVLRNTAEISEVRSQLGDLLSKERRVEAALRDLRRRVENCLNAFDRDRYKSTGQRLLLGALADEILIFEKLGYDLGVSGAHFLLGVAALLDERNQAAQECFKQFINLAEPDDRNLANTHFLAGMISYNRREFTQAIAFYQSAFRYSPEENRDWQSLVYVGELSFFLRKPKEVIEKAFFDVEERLKAVERRSPA
jgi:tetratricopeptide (TPR) repeat protein